MQFYPKFKEIDINKFSKIMKIKQGGYGTVYKIKRKETDEIYAAKIINGDYNEEDTQKMVNREIGILMKFSNLTIIQLIGYSFHDFDDENSVTIIMEYAENGSLAVVLNNIQQFNCPDNFTNTSRQIILAGIARGMKYLHDRNVIHRDLKPDNILLDIDFHPKITDFGLSKIFQNGHSEIQSGPVGTLCYMAPEVISHKKYDRKADVYSFGILMFEVLTDSQHYPELIQHKITNDEFSYKVVNEYYRPKFIDNDVKKPLRDLVEKCWSHDPNDRPTFGEIFDKLSKIEKDSDYMLDDVDINDFRNYIEDISEVDDPVEHLISKLEKTEVENQQLRTDNKQLKEKIDQLTKDNDNILSFSLTSLLIFEIIFVSFVFFESVPYKIAVYAFLIFEFVLCYFKTFNYYCLHLINVSIFYCIMYNLICFVPKNIYEKFVLVYIICYNVLLYFLHVTKKINLRYYLIASFEFVFDIFILCFVWISFDKFYREAFFSLEFIVYILLMQMDLARYYIYTGYSALLIAISFDFILNEHMYILIMNFLLIILQFINYNFENNVSLAQFFIIAQLFPISFKHLTFRKDDFFGINVFYAVYYVLTFFPPKYYIIILLLFFIVLLLNHLIVYFETEKIHPIFKILLYILEICKSVAFGFNLKTFHEWNV